MTVKFANLHIGDVYTALLGCLSGIAFPIGFAYVTNILGAFGGNKILASEKKFDDLILSQVLHSTWQLLFQ